MTLRKSARRRKAQAMPPSPAATGSSPAPARMTPDGSDPGAPSAEAQRTLLVMFMRGLEAGWYDDEILPIYERLNQRHREAQEERNRRALAGLRLGDQVAFPADALPKYLRGVTGKIVAFDGDDGVVVCLGRPLGRFSTGHVRSSARGVVKLAPDQAPE